MNINDFKRQTNWLRSLLLEYMEQEDVKNLDNNADLELRLYADLASDVPKQVAIYVHTRARKDRYTYILTQARRLCRSEGHFAGWEEELQQFVDLRKDKKSSGWFCCETYPDEEFIIKRIKKIYKNYLE